MNTKLTPPPKKGSKAEEEQWREQLHKRVMPGVSTSGDDDASIPSSSTYHGVTALSAPRTLSLPPTAKLKDGDGLEVQNETTDASNITLAADGTDTINGAATFVFSGSRARAFLRKRGTAWFARAL